MSFSSEAIKLLDYISKEFGIVVEWSSKSVIPVLQDIAGKYIRYEIATSIVWIIVLLLAEIVLIILARKDIKDWDTEVIQVYAICGIVLLLLPIVMQVFDIIRCVVFPEYQIFNYLQEVVKQLTK